ncbi:DUF885 domain-containing protein, partial [candidate division WOR-3 bacterium]|nr:DUF885 domain-containing protein [candidate division WOR-3 bacterium]
MRRIVLLVAAVAASGCAHGPLDRDLQSLGRRACDVYFEFHPVDATRYGWHARDSLLASYSPERVRAYLGRVRAFLDMLGRLDTSLLNTDDLIDRELLVSNLKMELFWFDRMRWQERNPKLYTGECIDAVYFLLLRDFAPLPERARLVAARLSQVPRFLAEARRNVRNPPRLYAQAAIDDLRTGEQFFRESAARLAERFPELAGVLGGAADSAAAAMRRWRLELEAMLPGLSDRFAMGRENFDYLLRTDRFLDFDADSLLRMGENLLRQTDSAIKATDSARHQYYLRHNEPLDTVFPAPAGFSKAEFRAYQQAEIESMRVWTQRQGVADVPEWVGRLEVKETPAFLLSIIPGLAMEPAAPLDSVQTGYVYVRPMEERLDSVLRRELYNSARKRGWKGGVVHEGFPGHHLQLSLANRHPSFIRRLQSNTPLIEGWALYCE